jgi:hypothetical protein
MLKNKHTNKNKRRKHNKTMKMRRRHTTQHKMKGGAEPVCSDISQLRENNIFNIFRSAIQLPKITLA